jgi:hypothetical protein
MKVAVIERKLFGGTGEYRLHADLTRWWLRLRGASSSVPPNTGYCSTVLCGSTCPRSARADAVSANARTGVEAG